MNFHWQFWLFVFIERSPLAEVTYCVFNTKYVFKDSALMCCEDQKKEGRTRNEKRKDVV